MEKRKIVFTKQVYVLAVGVNNSLQQHDGKGLTKTGDDVRHFTSHIKERFPEAFVVRLLGKDATCDNIRENIKRIAKLISKRGGSNSLFVFYYTGHGTTTSQYIESGNLMTTTTLLTDEASYNDQLLSGALPLGSKKKSRSLLYMINEIAARKLVLLDTCHGCASADVADANKEQAELKGVSKGITLSDLGTDGLPLEDWLLPDNCAIISACKMEQQAFEGEKGSYFTNAFLKAVSRAYYPPKGCWLGEDGGLNENLDEVDLKRVVGRVNQLMEQSDCKQTATIIYNAEDLRFPRLLDHHLSLEYTWDGQIARLIRPPVSDQVLRIKYVEGIEQRLKKDSLSSFIVYGEPLSGKTTAVSTACKGLCRSTLNNSIDNNNLRPLAWMSFDNDLPTNLNEFSSIDYILPFVTRHLDNIPDGVKSLADIYRDKYSYLKKESIFNSVTDLIEKNNGVVVFDNAELLLKEELKEVMGFVKHLLDTVRKGTVILITNDYTNLLECLNTDRHQYRVPEDDDHNLEIPLIKIDEARDILRHVFEIKRCNRLIGHRYNALEIVSAAYLLDNNEKIVLKGKKDIWRHLLDNINEFQEEAVFISLMKGVNSVDFYNSIEKPYNPRGELEQLHKMGLIIIEDVYFCVHNSTSKTVKKSFRDLYEKHREYWHTVIGNEYRKVANAYFDLYQTSQAFHHYYMSKRLSHAVSLFQDRNISSEMRNWGYSECLKRWLKILLNDKRMLSHDRLAIEILLIQLDRHELKFDKLSELEDLDKLAESQPCEIKANYNRAIGEMYLAKRDYDNAQKYFYEAFDLIKECISQKGIINISIRVEYTRIRLRIAELLTYRGFAGYSLEELKTNEKIIVQGLKNLAEEIDSDKLTIDNSDISDLVHQLSVVSAILSQAYLEMRDFENARLNAILCIKLSIFCRSYPTGDILGRAIGHIYYAMAITENDDLREDVSEHIRIIQYLLLSRKVTEIWWLTMASMVLALAKGGSGLSQCELPIPYDDSFNFNRALSSVDKGLKLLVNDVLPKGEGFPDSWEASPEIALRYLGWTKEIPSSNHNPDYNFLNLYAMNDEAFAQSFSGKRNPFTDPWRQAELLWARARIFRMELNVLCQKDPDGGVDDMRERYVKGSNAGKFAAYIGYVLARENRYTMLMAKLFTEVSRIYYCDNWNPNSQGIAIELMKCSIELASRTDCHLVLISLISELACMIRDNNKSKNPEENHIKAMTVLEQAFRFCKFDSIDDLSKQNHNLRYSPVLRDFTDLQIREKKEEYKYVLNFSDIEPPVIPDHAKKIIENNRAEMISNYDTSINIEKNAKELFGKIIEDIPRTRLRNRLAKDKNVTVGLNLPIRELSNKHLKQQKTEKDMLS